MLRCPAADMVLPVLAALAAMAALRLGGCRAEYNFDNPYYSQLAGWRGAMAFRESTRQSTALTVCSVLVSRRPRALRPDGRLLHADAGELRRGAGPGAAPAVEVP